MALTVALIVTQAMPVLADSDRIWLMQGEQVDGAYWLNLQMMAEKHIIRPWYYDLNVWHVGWKVSRDGSLKHNIHLFKLAGQVYFWDSRQGPGTALPVPNASDESWRTANCYCTRASWLAFYSTLYIDQYLSGKGVPAKLHASWTSYFWSFTSLIQNEFEKMGW